MERRILLKRDKVFDRLRRQLQRAIPNTEPPQYKLTIEALEDPGAGVTVRQWLEAAGVSAKGMLRRARELRGVEDEPSDAQLISAGKRLYGMVWADVDPKPRTYTRDNQRFDFRATYVLGQDAAMDIMLNAFLSALLDSGKSFPWFRAQERTLQQSIKHWADVLNVLTDRGKPSEDAMNGLIALDYAVSHLLDYDEARVMMDMGGIPKHGRKPTFEQFQVLSEMLDQRIASFADSRAQSRSKGLLAGQTRLMLDDSAASTSKKAKESADEVAARLRAEMDRRQEKLDARRATEADFEQRYSQSSLELCARDLWDLGISDAPSFARVGRRIQEDKGETDQERSADPKYVRDCFGMLKKADKLPLTSAPAMTAKVARSAKTLIKKK